MWAVDGLNHKDEYIIHQTIISGHGSLCAPAACWHHIVSSFNCKNCDDLATERLTQNLMRSVDWLSAGCSIRGT